MIEFIIKVCFDESSMLCFLHLCWCLTLKKFPYFFFNSLGTPVATSCVTSHETMRTVSLSDCNCGIYGIDDCNRCLQSLKRAGYEKEGTQSYMLYLFALLKFPMWNINELLRKSEALLCLLWRTHIAVLSYFEE